MVQSTFNFHWSRMDRLKGRKFGILADLCDQFASGRFSSTWEDAYAPNSSVCAVRAREAGRKPCQME